jgi:hypothetical protein
MNGMKLGYAVLMTACLLLSTSVVAETGQESLPEDELGPEIWVDGPDAVLDGSGPNGPHVAVDEFGTRVHVWEVFDTTGGDRDDVYVRRFDADGIPLADPVMVNTLIDEAQQDARVATSSDGSFLVIWESAEPSATNPTVDRDRVRSQAFDGDGNKIGTEQLLSTVSPESLQPLHIDVAALRVTDGSPGGYIVVWGSWTPNGTDTGKNIQARLVSPNGTPFGAQFQVNTTIAGDQTQPAVTELPDGGFLVVYTSPTNLLLGQRYDAAGQPVGGDFQINNTFESGVAQPDIELGWNGVVGVIWEDDEASGDADEIRARLFDSDMNPLGPDFRVNNLGTDDQRQPSLGNYGPAGFLAVWESDVNVTAGDDDSNLSVQARLITGPNTFDGLQFQLNDWIAGRQHNPAVSGWYGRLGTAFRSDSNIDENGAVITGRQIEHCIFCDDFEWGSEWRWPTVVE